ncbi:SMI1/KNR4 family protein [Labedaea rhizosphaerae]|uniref:SMI1/KNR4 family protein n=1 Tax=Labedaea rhizosphaerae TaxID=598644 RepID=A0A4R6SMD8_LABRH|nr:SMI1/KNR4 family protein [Labedaea rhizosphaerae]TDQ05299.1 hypothetical protein EV186_1011268 [Labedaea rhizosphaerae]
MSVVDLLQRAKGPLGPTVDVDFGVEQGPLAELARLLSAMNGFFAYNAGVHVFRAGDEGAGYDVLNWNSTQLWKSHYQGLADDFFCFGQDILGTQFAVHQDQVVAFDPEDATYKVIGPTLGDWAAWLAKDQDVNATNGLAHAWQKTNGALAPHERLLPRQLIILGGEVAFDNLIVSDAAKAMRVRGPIAKQIHDVPDGTRIRIEVTE